MSAVHRFFVPATIHEALTSQTTALPASSRKFFAMQRPALDLNEPEACMEQRGGPAVTCRGGGPSILLTQDRSVAQKPHWGFCCCANASLPWQAEQAHLSGKEKQSVPDGERPVVHIVIVCGLLQGASYSGAHPVFLL